MQCGQGWRASWWVGHFPEREKVAASQVLTPLAFVSLMPSFFGIDLVLSPLVLGP